MNRGRQDALRFALGFSSCPNQDFLYKRKGGGSSKKKERLNFRSR